MKYQKTDTWWLHKNYPWREKVKASTEKILKETEILLLLLFCVLGVPSFSLTNFSLSPFVGGEKVEFVSSASSSSS
jgi:hypothetical protein